MKLCNSALVLLLAVGSGTRVLGGTVLSDTFASSTLNAASPAPPTSSSAAYHLFSSKTWTPAPSIGVNHLQFGIASTTSGHIEVQALFSSSPLALTTTGDYIELIVTFVNTSGLFAQGGHVGFGLYNSGGVPPRAGGMNATAVSGTTGVTGGAQGWQGFVSRLAYTGGNNRISTRPAQSSTTGNNQDLITEGSGSQSYTGAVNLASSASALTVPAGSQLTEALRITLSAPGTLEISSRLYSGSDTNGTLLSSQSASASGANVLTSAFDSLAIGWRDTGNAAPSRIDIQSITVTTSLPVGGPSDTVAGIYFSQQPSDGDVGIALSPAVSVAATNVAGVPVTNAPITISLASGTGVLNGTLSQTTGSGGLAVFSNLSLSAAGSKQLRAACDSLTELSSTFTIVGNPPVVAALAPQNNASGLCVDTLLRITFDKPVFLQDTGAIRIYDASAPGVPVDTIDLSLNLDRSGATNVQPRQIGGESFTNQPVTVSGATATIFPHSGVLTTNRTYFVLMDPGVFTDTVGNVFPGISSSTDWRFTTKATGPANGTNIVVTADGSADFCTVQGAVDFVPNGSTVPRLINIRDGTYTEIVNVNNRHNLTFRGQNRSNTIIAYANNSAMNGSTHYRMAFKVNADGIALDTLTVTNSTPRGGSQAEALMVESDKKRFVAWNVNVCSYQDTILMNTSGTQCYFQDSLIQGETDFIWGGGNAFFTNCEIRSLFGGYLTQPRTAAGSNGISFTKCRLTKNGSISSTFGRSLGNVDGNVAYINCLIDTHITGWTDVMARYWEYGNSNITGTAAVSYNGNQLAANSPNLTNARTAVLWLGGWTPSLLPTILSHPTNSTLLAGQTAVFGVSATGLPTPSYQWRKNGVNISGATDATLTLSPVVPADAAVYSVVVSTPAGAAVSSNATLVVNVPEAPAFPGAEGAGAGTTGGRGGDVYYVTTLADTGAGSLRNGISTAPANGRTICFKVSGNIELNSTLTINRPNITVAGQTAPGDGVCIQDESFNITANNVIVRHMRTRLGTNNLAEADGMWISAGTNIIVDHVSASWSVDETLSASREIVNLTVQNCFITESLNNSIHVKGAHGYGGIISSSFDSTYSYLRNLYAHNNSRNPRIGSDSQAGTLRLDFRNNVIYNYGGRAGYTGGSTEFCDVNYVGNYCIKGPSSTYNYILEGGAAGTQVYQSGNYIDLNKNGLVDGSNTGWSMFSGTYTPVATLFPVPPATTELAPVACQRVVALSGAMPWRRDANDQRIARTVRLQYGSLVDFVGSPVQPTEYITNGTVVGVRGWPVLSSLPAPADGDNDGMPDYWELAMGFNPALSSDRNNTNAFTGFTRLEEYLNWVGEAHALCDRNGSVQVSLRQATGNATNLAYSVHSPTNGAVVLLADGFTAQFTAASATNGLAGFAFNVTDPVSGVTFGPVPYGILITTTNAPVVNTPPELDPITNRTVIAGAVVSFTSSATDTDTPPQTVTYKLQDSPAGASINTNSGAFYWRPTINQAATTNFMSIIASDNGTPVMSATQAFTVTVQAPLQPSFAPVSGGAFPPVLLVNGSAGPDYTVQASTNLFQWSAVLTTNPPALPFSWSDPDAAAFTRRFYRILLGP